MAPVPLEDAVNYSGVALMVVHLLSIIYFGLNVARSLYHSKRSLPVSQDVKTRLAKRKQFAWILYGLAFLSLVLAAYTGLGHANLSFQHWAAERNVQVGTTPNPSVLFSNAPSAQSSVSASPDLTTVKNYGFFANRVRWLGDTPVYHDAFEILAEKARRSWWGQQVDLAIVPWSVFVTVMGHRRGIRHLSAFLALAHLVNLSFAQNLFFMALVLTPVPLPDTALKPSRWNRFRTYFLPAKPRNWCLAPQWMLPTVLLSYGSILALPHLAGSSLFDRALGLSRALTFAPLLIHGFARPGMGGWLSRGKKVDPAYSILFRFLSLMALLCYVYSTVTGLKYNMPDAHFHRHSRIAPWSGAERSRWERTTTALGKLLGAAGDHPVVAAAAFDVMLSSLSMSLWAALRPLTPANILRVAIHVDKDQKIDESSPNLRGGAHTRKDTLRSKGKQVVIETSTDTPSPRRRGRPRKVKELPTEDDAVEEPGDDAYEPTSEEVASAPKGDPLAPGVDPEAAAVAWGLIAIGGLPLGSTGVLGGELFARP